VSIEEKWQRLLRGSDDRRRTQYCRLRWSGSLNAVGGEDALAVRAGPEPGGSRHDSRVGAPSNGQVSKCVGGPAGTELIPENYGEGPLLR
jgi:hypothetical protein